MSVYNDNDLLDYVDKIIKLIASGQYHSARTDQIILNCVKSFGNKWMEVIRIMIDLAKNNISNVTPLESDLDYFDDNSNDEEVIPPIFCDLVDDTKSNISEKYSKV